jgi:hypothetical protein
MALIDDGPLKIDNAEASLLPLSIVHVNYQVRLVVERSTTIAL